MTGSKASDSRNGCAGGYVPVHVFIVLHCVDAEVRRIRMLTVCTLAASKVRCTPSAMTSFACARSRQFFQSALSYAEISDKCGLADLTQAEALCVDCMQASLLFGKIDQWDSPQRHRWLLASPFFGRLKKRVTIENVVARDPSSKQLIVSPSCWPIALALMPEPAVARRRFMMA